MSLAHQHNRQAWNGIAARGKRFATPAEDKLFANPLAAVDPAGWLGSSVAGKRALCLGAGGGRQSALLAAAGAQVTVVDISSRMLALDRQVAAERGLEVRAIEASMDNLSMLEAAGFDIVAQPVSTCYVPDVVAVYRQVARVLGVGGVYISQHKQPVSLQAARRAEEGGYLLTECYYRGGPLPAADAGSPHREAGTHEFLHRWDQLIGGLCRSGFVVEDLMEPMHARADAEWGTFSHRCQYAPPYVRIKARRVGAAWADGAGITVWTPDSQSKL